VRAYIEDEDIYIRSESDGKSGVHVDAGSLRLDGGKEKGRGATPCFCKKSV
jgi:hypothetical protein